MLLKHLKVSNEIEYFLNHVCRYCSVRSGLWISVPLSEADSMASIASRASLFVKSIAPQIDLAELLERKTVKLQMELSIEHNEVQI